MPTLSYGGKQKTGQDADFKDLKGVKYIEKRRRL
jgi:hypothetical protein